MKSSTTSNSYAPPASLLRRFAAMIYDSLILVALLMLISAIALTFTDGEAIAADNYYYKLTIWLTIFIFFHWFWSHGGQTIGMLAWKIKVVTANGEPLTVKYSAIRFLAAILSFGIFGMGFWWSLFNRERQTWHDIISKTKTIHIVN